MTGQFLEVRLQDEAPNIGCGNRLVFVRVGRKWATLRCPYTLRTGRIEVDAWRGIARTAIPRRVRHSTLIRAARLFERRTGQKRSAAVKAMLNAAKAEGRLK